MFESWRDGSYAFALGSVETMEGEARTTARIVNRILERGREISEYTIQQQLQWMYAAQKIQSRNMLIMPSHIVQK